MSTDTHSLENKVAPNGLLAAHTTPAQSDTQKSSEAKDTETLFKEAFEEARKETIEEHYAKFPFLSE